MSDPPTTRAVPRPEFVERPWDAVVERLRPFRGDPRVAVVLLLVAALAAGVIWYRIGSHTGGASAFGSEASAAAGPPAGASRSSSARSRSGIGASTASTTPSTTPSTSTAPAAEVVVDVAGDVVRPGVVRLPTGARVTDALTAAGGARPDADLGRLNLAAKLVDGQHLAVPKVGEPAPVSPAASGSTGDAAAAPTPDTPLDLNTATQAQLEALPGIGPSLARAILAERDRTGGFRSVDELRRVRGIGDTRFAQLAPLVRV